MTVEPIGILIALAGLYAMAAGLGAGAYLLSACALLGAAAALILPALGGANIQPAHFALVFVAISVALRPRSLVACLSCLSYPGPGFWFTLFTLYSVLTAFFMPRIFHGSTIVYSLARNNDLHAILSAPLAPSTSNLTQSVYMLGSLAIFAIIGGFARLGGSAIVARALIVTAILCLCFAIADVVTYATNTSELLSIIRNANYRMLNDGEIQGFKRIVGSFTEAGAFGYAALALFSFTLMLGLEGFPSTSLAPITAALATALILCTSTTAYVASGVTALIVVAFCIARILRRRATPRHLAYVATCLLAVPLLVMVVMLIPAVWQSVSNLVHATLTTKLETQSGEERMRWNVQALNAFFDTSGMGAGLGSVRASSFLVALLANVGVPGAVLFLIFLASLVRSVLRREPGRSLDDMIGVSALLSCTAQITAASISAGAIDLGPLFAITAGLATAYAIGPMRRPSRAIGRTMRRLALPPSSLTSDFNQLAPAPLQRSGGAADARRARFASRDGAQGHV